MDPKIIKSVFGNHSNSESKCLTTWHSHIGISINRARNWQLGKLVIFNFQIIDDKDMIQKAFYKKKHNFGI